MIHDMTKFASAGVLVTVLTGVLLAGCETADAPSAPDPRPASNRAMAERLAGIAAAVDPADFPYANGPRADAMLVRAREAPDGPGKFQLLIQAAAEKVRAGLPEEGAELVDEAGKILEKSDVRMPEKTFLTMSHLWGLAQLRLGEQENCLDHHNTESCLVPIREPGFHEIDRGSRGAILAYSRLLEVKPGNLSFRWLLNLAHMTLGEYPGGVPAEHLIPPAVFDSEADIGRFRDVAGERGVAVRALSGGAALEDFDGDGRIDVVASSWGLEDPLRFFHQRADGTFEERSEAAWLGGQLGGLNLVHADYDNDGDADLLVLRGGWLFDQGSHPNSLLQNQGDGTFVDVTEAAGLLAFLPSHAAAWGDVDHDGWLDLFVGYEPNQGERHRAGLYRSRGDGTFEEIAAAAGLEITGIVKGAAWGDFDNDGFPDLYVSRFGEPNLLFRHQGVREGVPSFADVTAAAGVAEPRNSFPTWFFDYDNDGWLDLLVASFAGFTGDALPAVVADYLEPGATDLSSRLYRNRGDGTFEDVTRAAGLDRALLTMGANFGDFDNDGWLDLYFGTGEPTMSTLVPNRAFRNDGGRRFQDITTSGGFGSIQKGHGVAFGDVDGDGDQDVYVTLGGAYSGDVYPNVLFENPGHGKRWLTLRFEGVQSNRGALGSRVRIVIEGDAGEREIHRVVGTGGSFGSSTLQLEVGLGDARAIRELEVFWPVSGRWIAYQAELDSVLTVREELSHE